ncbi:MAG: hypothetical protein ACXU9C_01710 [Xanthobacteraceae bacterium]
MASVPTDPWSAAFSAFGPALTAAAQPAGPSSAANQNSQDASGWTVNVGGGSASASRTTLPTASQAFGSPVVLMGLAVVLYLAMKHK